MKRALRVLAFACVTGMIVPVSALPAPGDVPYAPDEGPGYDKAELSRRSREEFNFTHPDATMTIAKSDRPVATVAVALVPVPAFPPEEPLAVRAQITRGEASKVTLFVRRDASAIFAQIPMASLGGNIWQAQVVPEFTKSETLRFYVRAEGAPGTPAAFSSEPESPAVAHALPPSAPWSPPLWLYAIPLLAVAAWRMKSFQMGRTQARQSARTSRPRRQSAQAGAANRRNAQPAAGGATTRNMKAGMIGAGGPVMGQQLRPAPPAARTRPIQRREE
jgi:hypothetical protein